MTTFIKVRGYSEYSSYESICCIESKLPCVYHRYNTVYICSCGKLISHSQGDWNEHRLHKNGINLPSEYYEHGDTVLTLFSRMQGFGTLPYFDPAYQDVYLAIASQY